MAFKAKSYNWAELLKLPTKELERQLKLMRKAAMQRYRSATPEMRNITRVFGKAYQDVAAPLDFSSATNNLDRRNQILSRISSTMSWLNQSTTTRTGFRDWVNSMKKVLEDYAVGQPPPYLKGDELKKWKEDADKARQVIRGLSDAEIQRIGTLIGESKDAVAAWGYEYGPEAIIGGAFTIWTRTPTGKERRTPPSERTIKKALKEWAEKVRKDRIENGPIAFDGIPY